MLYKDAAYRSRVVIDPRGVLADFGTEVGDDVEVRVWDSSAEIRYLVLPERPAGTEGLGEDQLAELIDRDATIGVKKVRRACWFYPTRGYYESRLFALEAVLAERRLLERFGELPEPVDCPSRAGARGSRS